MSKITLRKRLSVSYRFSRQPGNLIPGCIIDTISVNSNNLYLLYAVSSSWFDSAYSSLGFSVSISSSFITSPDFGFIGSLSCRSIVSPDSHCMCFAFILCGLFLWFNKFFLASSDIGSTAMPIPLASFNGSILDA